MKTPLAQSAGWSAQLTSHVSNILLHLQYFVVFVQKCLVQIPNQETTLKTNQQFHQVIFEAGNCILFAHNNQLKSELSDFHSCIGIGYTHYTTYKVNVCMYKV